MNDSKNALMDRHLKRVERWLKRCVVACKCGSWSDALAEAECLEAETKGLREDLWGAVEDEALGVPDRGMAYSAFSMLKITILAMAMVLAAVIPISFDPESGILEFAPQKESVVLLSSTESDIIDALRQSLSSGNSGKVVISVEMTEEAEAAESGGGIAMAAERTKPAPKNTAAVRTGLPQAQAEEVAKSTRRPSADEVISLVQIGQRALRSSEPGVIVVP